jgi:hypothetical protein
VRAPGLVKSEKTCTVRSQRVRRDPSERTPAGQESRGLRLSALLPPTPVSPCNEPTNELISNSTSALQIAVPPRQFGQPFSFKRAQHNPKERSGRASEKARAREERSRGEDERVRGAKDR